MNSIVTVFSQNETGALTAHITTSAQILLKKHDVISRNALLPLV